MKKNFLGTQTESRFEMNITFVLLIVFLHYLAIVSVAIGCPVLLLLEAKFTWGFYGHCVWLVVKYGFFISVAIMLVLNVYYSIWAKKNK